MIANENINVRIASRVDSIKRGRELGRADAGAGKAPDMRMLGALDTWLAHGYSEGYAEVEFHKD